MYCFQLLRSIVQTLSSLVFYSVYIPLIINELTLSINMSDTHSLILTITFVQYIGTSITTVPTHKIVNCTYAKCTPV